MAKTIGIFGGAFDPVHVGHTSLISDIQKIIDFEKSGLWKLSLGDLEVEFKVNEFSPGLSGSAPNRLIGISERSNPYLETVSHSGQVISALYSAPYPVILRAIISAFLSPEIKSFALIDLSVIQDSIKCVITVPFLIRALEVKMSSSLAVIGRISTVSAP